MISKIKWRYAFLYLDGIVIFSRSVEKPINWIQEELGLMLGAYISLKSKNSFFSGDRMSNLRQ